MGGGNRTFAGLAAEGRPPDQLKIDATYLKEYRTAAACSKRDSSPMRRALEGRSELVAARRLR